MSNAHQHWLKDTCYCLDAFKNKTINMHSGILITPWAIKSSTESNNREAPRQISFIEVDRGI